MKALLLLAITWGSLAHADIETSATEDLGPYLASKTWSITPSIFVAQGSRQMHWSEAQIAASIDGSLQLGTARIESQVSATLQPIDSNFSTRGRYYHADVRGGF